MRNYAQAIPTMDYVENGVFYSMPVVLPDGTWGHYKKEANGDIPGGADNLVAAARTADKINKWDRMLTNAFLQLDLYKGLTFKTIASYNHSITQNGSPVGSYYGWRVAGIFRSQSEIDEMNRLAAEKGVEGGLYQEATTKPGDFRFVDLNGDGHITDADRTIIGDGYPTFTYGLNLSASYKNFDFSMNLYGVAGMDILSYSSARLRSVYAPDGGYQNVLKEYVQNVWSESNPNALYPRITKTDYNKNMRVSDAYIQKGDWGCVKTGTSPSSISH